MKESATPEVTVQLMRVMKWEGEAPDFKDKKDEKRRPVEILEHRHGTPLRSISPRDGDFEETFQDEKKRFLDRVQKQ